MVSQKERFIGSVVIIKILVNAIVIATSVIVVPIVIAIIHVELA